MATAARKLKTTSVDDNQLQLLYGDDALTKYWSSSLFNTVYLRHDIADKHSCWKDDDSLDFQNFMNELRNIAADYRDRDKELESWSETETINNWVKRLLYSLGWENNCKGKLNPYLEETTFRYDSKSYRTDILIVDLPNEKMYVKDAEGDKRIQVARESVLMPVEVKYWQRLEEYRQGKKEEKRRADNGTDDIARTATPNEQIIQYMTVLNKSWGILTDGARWRLFNSDLSSEDAERYYEFNFAALFQAMTTEETGEDSREIIEAAKYFYHFFSKQSFYPTNEGDQPFADEVLQYSKKYVNKVEEDLKDRFVKAMNIACNGFNKAARSNGNTQDLVVVRNVAESALFNILFIKSLESRGVLPMASTDYKKISLSSMIDKIERFDPEKEDLLNLRELERAFKKGNGNAFGYTSDGHELHDRILRLTGVIHQGTTSKDNFGFEIAGFRESVFSDNEWKFFKSCKIKNQDWARILFELGYSESESLNRKYQQIPYSYFTARQLGSIYESFLDFKLDEADLNMIFEKKQWREVDLKNAKYRNSDLPKVRKGELFFTPDNEDRKVTGSYYTPDNIVQFILNDTLKPIVTVKNPDDILKLKICDPAMGSGHFLAGALKFLTAKYLTIASEKETNEYVISEVKDKILHNCIFGVDINPRAVKLAKMSLWLETAHPGHALEDLNDQIKNGDSLIDDKKVSPSLAFSWKKEFDLKFDAIVGNPPYVFVRNNKIKKEEKTFLETNYHWSRYQINIAQSFVELSFKLLRPEGRLGFILPNTWLTIQSSDVFREQLITQSSELHIINCFDKMFEDASVDNSILIAQKRDHEESCELKTQFYENSQFNFIETKEIAPSKEIINCSKKSAVKTLSLVDGLTDVGHSYEVKSGFVAYEVGKGDPKQTKQMKDDRVYHHTKKTNSKCRKYLDGKDVRRFNLSWSGQWIEYGKNLAAPRDPRLYEGVRVLIRQIPSKPPFCINAAVSAGDEVNDRNSIIVKMPSEDEAYYLVGILNSVCVSQWFVEKFDKFQRKTFPQIKTNELESFPLPENISEKEKKEIINISKQLSKLYTKEGDKQKAKSLEDALEKLVFKLLFINDKAKRTKAA